MAKRTTPRTTPAAAPAAAATPGTALVLALPGAGMLGQQAPIPAPAPAAAAAAPAPAVVAKKGPGDSGRNPAEIAGNAAIVAALRAAGLGTRPWPTGAEMAAIAGFKAPITTAWVGVLAHRAGMAPVYKAGAGNKYTYALVPLPAAAAA